MRENILIKGMKIIETLAMTGPLSLEEIYKETNISKSAIYRILCTLEELKYISRYKKDAYDIWRLELKFLNISSFILSRLDIKTEIRDILISLADETKEIVQLGILHDGKVLFLDVIKKYPSLVSSANVGDSAEINICVSGYILASYLEENELNLLLDKAILPKNTIYTIVDKDKLKAEFKVVRQMGFSYDDQKYAIAHRCIGAPIFDYTNKAIASINISGHVSTINGKRIDELVDIVKEKAIEASIRLGYVGYDKF
jgi:IclR family transcriptional regulator, KDG regulon repressor